MDINYKDSLAVFGLDSLDGISEHRIKEIYFELAKKFHPDKGGSAEDFIRLREAYSYLKVALNNPKLRQNKEDQNTAEELNDYEKAYQKVIIQLREYENIINSQIKIINLTAKAVNTRIENFNLINESLKKWLDDSLADLEEVNRTRWWEIVVARRRPTQEEYITEYNQIIATFNKKTRELNDQFQTDLVATYQQSFNSFIDMLKENG